MNSHSRRDLNRLFSAFTLPQLHKLRNAFDTHRVVKGRYFDGAGRGCLLWHLSEHQIHDRASSLEFLTAAMVPDLVETAKRIVRAFDAGADRLVALKGYEDWYPDAGYVLSDDDVYAAIKRRCRAREGERAKRKSRTATPHHAFVATAVTAVGCPSV